MCVNYFVNFLIMILKDKFLLTVFEISFVGLEKCLVFSFEIIIFMRIFSMLCIIILLENSVCFYFVFL